jgi:hypothetical protein
VLKALFAFGAKPETVLVPHSLLHVEPPSQEERPLLPADISFSAASNFREVCLVFLSQNTRTDSLFTVFTFHESSFTVLSGFLLS